MEDLYGHKIFNGDLYFEGRYLQKLARQKRRKFVKFEMSQMSNHFFLCPREIDEMFVDFDEEHMKMNVEEFIFLESKSLAK